MKARGDALPAAKPSAVHTTVAGEKEREDFSFPLFCFCGRLNTGNQQERNPAGSWTKNPAANFSLETTCARHRVAADFIPTLHPALYPLPYSPHRSISPQLCNLVDTKSLHTTTPAHSSARLAGQLAEELAAPFSSLASFDDYLIAKF
jgi:hypothetical protein